MKKLLTLCIVHQHPRVLLGMKKRGFGAERWNGFGGKVDTGETVEEAARREVREESGIEVNGMVKHGVLDFEFRGKPEILEVHIFRAENFTGEPGESDEMIPRWFHIADIPYAKMWPDDEHWLPLLLNKKKFSGRFLFGEGDKILEQELKEVDEI